MSEKNFQINIFFGDAGKETARLAFLYDSSAVLVNHSNYKHFLDFTPKKDITIYTSLKDLPDDLNVVWNILTQATSVTYCPTDHWSDNKTVDITDPTASLQGFTEHILLRLKSYVTVKNLDLNLLPSPKATILVSRRISKHKQLWIVGCSLSHGTGVDPRQRYGQLIADELGLPCSFLTGTGTAIDWAADQIIRSDIRPDDIVIWGLTHIRRLTYVDNHKVMPVTIARYDPSSPYYDKNLENIVSKKEIFSQNTFYNHAYSVERVINFCKKAKAQLLIIGLLADESMDFLHANPEYHLYPYPPIVHENHFVNYKFQDLAADGWHPGPRQHQMYKNFILPLIKSS